MSGGSRNRGPLGPLPSQQRLSSRARQRLRMAARMLRAQGVKIDDTNGFYPGVLASIAALADLDRTILRGLVDWVGDYEGREEDAT